MDGRYNGLDNPLLEHNVGTHRYVLRRTIVCGELSIHYLMHSLNSNICKQRVVTWADSSCNKNFSRFCNLFANFFCGKQIYEKLQKTESRKSAGEKSPEIRQEVELRKQAGGRV